MEAIPFASHSHASRSDDLKQFFMGLYSSRLRESGNSTPSSPSSSGSSTLVPSDDDEPLSIFTSDKEAYDFESQLPPSVLTSIQRLLDEPDKFDEDFDKSRYKHLNPEAPSFVPSHTSSFPTNRTHTRLPPINTNLSLPLPSHDPLPVPFIPLPKPTLQAQAPWITIFSAASLTPPNAFSVLASHAHDLVHAHIWHTTALGDLSQHFLWTACAPEGAAPVSEHMSTFYDSAGSGSFASPIRETMAPFAMEVYRALFDVYGEEVALSFVWHLRESVVGTFKAAWCAKESTKAISYHFPPSSEYVLSATHLCAFIGDLFRFNLTLIQHTRLCLSILMQELNSLEHIAAIGVLIEHAGPGMWVYPSQLQPSPWSLSDQLPKAKAFLPLLGTPGVSSSDAQLRSLRGNGLFEAANTFKRDLLVKTEGLGNGSSVLLRSVVRGVDEKDERVGKVLAALARLIEGGWGEL